MAKRKTQETAVQPVQEHIEEQGVSHVLTTNFMPYAMSVIVSRAIVEIDGLKPSQRKVLYTMYKMGLLNGPRAKSAKISGQVLVLNPHSDSAAYETMVRMTTDNEALLAPLVDSKGNFGKHYSNMTTFAASRYTEARLAPIAQELFRGINKNTVPFVPNYDATTTEPVLLPETFPLILANESEGIAVGHASKIPSFNLSELCRATIKRIQNPGCDIMDVMPGPDFPGGGTILLEPDVMKNVYETGRGSIKLASRWRTDPKNNIVEIYEIPYTTTDGDIIEEIHGLMEKGTVKEISGLVRNETDRNGLKIAFDCKRGTDPEQLMKKLMAKTRLQSVFPCNFNILIDGELRTLGVCSILDEWTRWRRGCVKNALLYDRDKKTKELHMLEGLEKILLDLDRAVQIVRSTEEDSQVVPNLMAGFNLDAQQAEYVAEIRLRNFNKQYILARTADIEGLRKEIEKLEKQIRSPKEIDKIIIRELKDVDKKYGIPRRTEIVPYSEEDHVYVETVEDYPVKMYRTREGYIKKVPASLVRSDTLIKSKDGDEVVQWWDAMNSTEMLFFMNNGDLYKLYASDMPDHKPADAGAYYRNLFDVNPDNEIAAMMPMNPDNDLYFGYENGKVARIQMKAYATKTRRKKIVNAFNTDSRLLNIFSIPNDVKADLAMTSDAGKVLVFATKLLSPKTTKGSQGVQAIRLGKNACASAFLPAAELKLDSYKGLQCRALPASGGKTPAGV